MYEPIGQGLGVLLRIVLAALEVDDDQAGFAVFADQLGSRFRRCGPGRGDVIYQGRATELLSEVGAYRAGLLTPGSRRRGHQNQHLLATLSELVGQHRDGVGRFGFRVLETAWRQTLGDGDAEDRRGEEDQYGDSDD